MRTSPCGDFLFSFFRLELHNVKPYNCNDERGQHNKVAAHAADAEHKNIICQPTRCTYEIHYSYNSGVFNTERNCGNNLSRNGKYAYPAVPRKHADHQKHNAEHHLKHKGAFIFLYSVPIDHVCATTEKVEHHSRVSAEKQILYTAAEGVAYLADNHTVIHLLLHSYCDYDRT